MYYLNGKLKSESNYVNGKMNGLAKQYYENGKIEFEIIYTDGNESSKKHFDENGMQK